MKSSERERASASASEMVKFRRVVCRGWMATVAIRVVVAGLERSWRLEIGKGGGRGGG